MAHQSTALPWPLERMISGARYSGVPHSVHVRYSTCVGRWVGLRPGVARGRGVARAREMGVAVRWPMGLLEAGCGGRRLCRASPLGLVG